MYEVRTKNGTVLVPNRKQTRELVMEFRRLGPVEVYRNGIIQHLEPKKEEGAA